MFTRHQNLTWSHICCCGSYCAGTSSFNNCSYYTMYAKSAISSTTYASLKCRAFCKPAAMIYARTSVLLQSVQLRYLSLAHMLIILSLQIVYNLCCADLLSVLNSRLAQDKSNKLTSGVAELLAVLAGDHSSSRKKRISSSGIIGLIICPMPYSEYFVILHGLPKWEAAVSQLLSCNLMILISLSISEFSKWDNSCHLKQQPSLKNVISKNQLNIFCWITVHELHRHQAPRLGWWLFLDLVDFSPLSRHWLSCQHYA